MKNCVRRYVIKSILKSVGEIILLLLLFGVLVAIFSGAGFTFKWIAEKSFFVAIGITCAVAWLVVCTFVAGMKEEFEKLVARAEWECRDE